jgi:hypothetical protein
VRTMIEIKDKIIAFREDGTLVAFDDRDEYLRESAKDTSLCSFISSAPELHRKYEDLIKQCYRLDQELIRVTGEEDPTLDLGKLKLGKGVEENPYERRAKKVLGYKQQGALIACGNR